MPNNPNTDIPRKWRTWRTGRIEGYISQMGDIADDAVQWLIEDMQDELDERDYMHNTFTPDEWDDTDAVNVPSYTS